MFMYSQCLLDIELYLAFYALFSYISLNIYVYANVNVICMSYSYLYCTVFNE